MRASYRDRAEDIPYVMDCLMLSVLDDIDRAGGGVKTFLTLVSSNHLRGIVGIPPIEGIAPDGYVGFRMKGIQCP